MNETLEGTLEEIGMEYFEVIQRHIPEGTEKISKNFSQHSLSPDAELNLRPQDTVTFCLVYFQQ